MSNKWKTVTPREKCPICDHGDWCTLSADGEVVGCMRVSEGAFRTKESAKGGTLYFHRLKEGPARDSERRPVTAVPSREPAPVAIRHKVYAALLASCPLSRSHQLDLVRRGLKPPFETAGYGSLPEKGRFRVVEKLRDQFSDATLLSVPGIVRRQGNDGTPYITIAGKAGLLIPVRNEMGQIVALKIRADGLKGDRYRWLSSKSADGPTSGTPAHCPLGVAPGTESVRLTEGPLKADVAGILSGFPTIAADNVGAHLPAVELAQRLGAKTVRMSFDSDAITNPIVARHTVACAEALELAGIAVEFETWNASDGKGIDDLLAAGGTPTVLTGDEAKAYRESLVPAAETESLGERVEVVIEGSDEHKTTDAAEAVLATDPSIFQRGGVLVRVVVGSANDGIERPGDAPRIAAIPEPVLRDCLTRLVRFLKPNDKGVLVPARPPGWALKTIHQRGDWRDIRRLEGIANGPVLRPDGSVHTEPGYDPITRQFLASALSVTIPEMPSLDDAIRAMATLLDLVADFPFASPTHRSSWLSLLLTAVGRSAFRGPSPLHLVDKNVRGSGGTLLCEIVSLIVLGRDFARMSNPRDDEECRKRITALVLAADLLVLIDNINGPLGCGSLDAALTGTVWKDRRLGQSEMIEAPLSIVWAASGNNVQLQADTARRILHSRLESREERPETREGFRYPDLTRHVLEHRGELLGAALTILSAFIRAGKPDPGLKPWGSFEGWSKLIRGALVWAGQPDPGETRQELVETSDTEAGALRGLLTNWHELDPHNGGLTAAEIIERIEEHAAECPNARSALLDLVSCPGGKLPSPRSVGQRLRHFRGRVVAGQSLNQRPGRAGVARWMVTTAAGGCKGGLGDSLLAPPDISPTVEGRTSTPPSRVGMAETKQPLQPKQPFEGETPSGTWSPDFLNSLSGDWGIDVYVPAAVDR